MFNRHLYFFIVFFIKICYGIDPISIGIGGALLGAFGYNFEYLKQNTYCKFKECCSDSYIPLDINGKCIFSITNYHAMN